MKELYYQKPDDKIFLEVKSKAILLWEEIADHPSYLQEKTDKIKNIENVSENMMYIIAMFDINNQGKLSRMLSNEARKAISDRLKSVDFRYNVFK